MFSYVFWGCTHLVNAIRLSRGRVEGSIPPTPAKALVTMLIRTRLGWWFLRGYVKPGFLVCSGLGRDNYTKENDGVCPRSPFRALLSFYPFS